MDAKSYGVNCPQCFDPNWTANPRFLNALSAVTAGAKPLIRLHGWGMVSQSSGEFNQGWLNTDGTWNAPKIKQALTPLVSAGFKILIDIPSGPGGEGDIKDPVALASFAAALVKIVNVDNHFAVKYWEIPNEGESKIAASQMATLLSSASKAMKAIDPTILVGGPATAGINVDYISQVVQTSLSDIDFISVHDYGGDGKQSDEVSYAGARKTIASISSLRQRLTDIAPGKRLPIFLDEYNIGWDFTPKIQNNKGAVYFSLIQGGVVDAGGDVSAVWDFSPGHNMSIAGDDCKLYDSAYLFSLMNEYFYGKQVAAATSDESIYAFAVDAGSSRSVVLSNLKDSEQRVGIVFNGWKPRHLSAFQISAAGKSGPRALSWKEMNKHGYVVPAKSVSILISH